MVSLGRLPGTEGARPYATTSDGSVIVGVSEGAFIWDAANGIRDQQDVLVNDYGLSAELAG
jgi:hypothetical protein